MSNIRVICIGDILFDLLADQLGHPLEKVESWTGYPGGAPANVACGLVKLGTPAAFIGCIGKDKAGDELVSLLESVGVNITGVQLHPNAPTRKVYVVRTETGDREFAGFGEYRPDEFADAYLQASELPTELFLDAEFMMLHTLEFAYPQTREAIFRALELSGQYNVKIALDVNSRPMFWSDPSQAAPLIKEVLRHVDFLKLSKEEAEWLFETADAGAIAHRLGSVEGVLVTDGGKDVSYCLSDSEGKISPPPVKVVDTTGAGDAFFAGFLHQLLKRKISSLRDPEIAKEVVAYACAVGGLTATKAGAIASQPTAQEVEAFLT